jgi:multiple antibiotic resistance protein
MTELFASAFVTLFVVIDPPGVAPIYAGLTRGAEPQQRRAMALRAAFIATLILFGFALFGRALLAALHIDLDSFRIAGGIMLFIIALDMVLERRTQRREERAEKVLAAPEIEDVSVFPIGMPMIAGPGAIATIMLLVSKAEGIEARLAVFAALAVVLGLTLAALLAAGWIVQLVGSKIESAVTRLLGVLLAALAAQYVIDGVRGSFGI